MVKCRIGGEPLVHDLLFSPVLVTGLPIPPPESWPSGYYFWDESGLISPYS